jgi:hypothetical protein
MTDCAKPLIDGWLEGARPGYRGNPLHWLERWVRLPHSARSTQFDSALAPWLNDVIQAVCDDRVKSIMLRLPTGAGKTTFLELIACWIVAQQPGPMLLVEQTDDTSKDWAESRLMPVFEACEPVARLFPEDRHQKRKSSIIWPHMAMFMSGANMSGLQGKSMRYVYCDEVWQFKQGILGEAVKRLHDRWNRKFICCSQGWDSSHDADDLWKLGRTFEWGCTCAGCGTWAKWSWLDIKYAELPEGETEWNWQMLRESVRHECRECGHHTPNTTAGRRAMAAASSYRGDAEGNWVDGHVNFTLPAWAVWWIDWADLVVEWVKANTAKRTGLIEPLKQFIQKRGAQTWTLDDDRPVVNLLAADYSRADYADGQKIDGEVTRFLTVDVQKDHFWVLCRAWTAGGASKLIYFDKVLTVDTIVDIQQRLGVRDNLVFMDSGYESGTVYDYCARASKYNESGWLWNSGWTALKGSKQERFAHVPAQGKKVDRFFSPPSKVLGTNGKHCRLINWSNLIAKDKLTHLRSAGPDVWAFPADIGPAYMKQIVSEMKRDVVDKATKAITQRYVPLHADNHAWDCEAMQVVAASITHILRASQEAH